MHWDKCAADKVQPPSSFVIYIMGECDNPKPFYYTD